MKNKPQAVGGGRRVSHDEAVDLYKSKDLSKMNYEELKIIEFELKNILFKIRIKNQDDEQKTISKRDVVMGKWAAGIFADYAVDDATRQKIRTKYQSEIAAYIYRKKHPLKLGDEEQKTLNSLAEVRAHLLALDDDFIGEVVESLI